MPGLIPLLLVIGGLIVGSIFGYYTRRSIAKRQARTVEAKVDKLIGEAKKEASNIISGQKKKP